MNQLDQLQFNQSQLKNTEQWLKLGVTALAGSGLFAILLVASRTPGVQEIIPWIDFFRTALVVHVDLSVLVWFLAFGAVLWRLHDQSLFLNNYILGAAWLGLVLICVTPFTGDSQPVMNNYVPVLRRPMFFAGLGIFTVAILLHSLSIRKPPSLQQPANLAIWTGVVAVIIGLLSFAWSWFSLDPATEHHAYYEFLFWSGGHTLQVGYTQFMLAAWLWLAAASGVTLPVRPKVLSMIILLGAAPLLPVPVLHILYPIASAESLAGFTLLMQYGGGLAAIPIGMILLLALIKADHSMPEQKPARYALWASFILFSAGGLIGISISGVNTVIPAHYHGSIVGVTLSFMGLSYLLLPKLGYGLHMAKTAKWQSVVYGSGQMLHITGLALSGVLGIKRKTAGAEQGLDQLSKIITMGVMGLGGLLAVIGGIMFVVVMLNAFYRGKSS